MERNGYKEFQNRLDSALRDDQNSITNQLVSLTDIYQKIAAIYAFANQSRQNAFHNAIVFQIVETALHYGVCIPVRVLASGKQTNEISLFKLTQEFKNQCTDWTRLQFVTWDGKPYDPTELQKAHEKSEREILEENFRNGKNGAWLPQGQHEEIYRRHSVFDGLSGVKSAQDRSPDDKANSDRARCILRDLKMSAKEIVDFGNRYLAHRINVPGDAVSFDVSLDKIEKSIIGLWMCFNQFNSIFYDSYTTPDIIHSLDLLENLALPLVPRDDESNFLRQYELIKQRMESRTNPISFKQSTSLANPPDSA